MKSPILALIDVFYFNARESLITFVGKAVVDFQPLNVAVLMRLRTKIIVHTRCTFRSVCLPRISITFELTGNTCALLLVGVACDLGQSAMCNKV